MKTLFTKPMMLGFSQPAIFSIFHCLVSGSTSSSDSLTLSSNDTSTDSGPIISSERNALSLLKDSIESLKLKLQGEKKNILDSIDCEDFEFNKPCMRRHIKALRKNFFDALMDPEIHSFDKDTKVRILALSPEGFKEKLDGVYNEYADPFDREMQECNTEKKDLELQIERVHKRYEEHLPDGADPDAEKASELHERLEAVKASLKGFEKNRSNCAVELQKFKDYFDNVKSLSHRVIGENSIPAIYKSYLASERSLARKEYRYAKLSKHGLPSEEADKGCKSQENPLRERS